MKVYIAFGSNLGDRAAHIEKASEKMATAGIHVVRVSPVYETKALCGPGHPAMPDFLNGVFEVETEFTPENLLKILQDIETDMGRETKGDWAPRVIDLDILFYGDLVIQREDLEIPHPEIQNRFFVLKPLSDLIPDFKHPTLLKTIRRLLDDID